MNILMTGGTGFIGKRFIDRFQDYNFTVLTRNIAKAKSTLSSSSVSFIEELDALESLNEYDAVINLVGEPIIDKRWTDQQKDIICQSRWGVTEKLVKLFEKSDQPPKVFLSGSAIGIYGQHGNQVITENHRATEEDFPIGLCKQWESIAEEVSNIASESTRLVILRIGVVLHPSGGALSKMLLPFKLCLGGRIGSGEQYMSWIHMSDILNAIDFLLHNSACEGAYNLTSPEPQKNSDFTQILAAELKRPAIFPVPEFVLKILMGESSQLLLDSQRVIPERLMGAGFEFEYPTLEKTFSDLLG